MPPPEPPIVNDGRKISGKPSSCAAWFASSIVRVLNARGTPRPIFSIAALKSSRSSAFLIAATLAPISSTPYFSSTPFFARASARLSAVWPPSVGRIASGRSLAMIASTTSGTSGSTYVPSAYSGSVMIVAGFELTRTTW
jgi:hypothetical protein